MEDLLSSPIVSTILTVLGSLVVAGTIYIRLTPTQDDDAWLIKQENKPIIGQLLAALRKFSVIERKPKK